MSDADPVSGRSSGSEAGTAAGSADAAESRRAQDERLKPSLLRALAARMSAKLRASLDPEHVRLEALAMLRRGGDDAAEDDDRRRRRTLDAAVSVLEVEARRRLGKADRPEAAAARTLEEAVSRTAVAPSTPLGERGDATALLRALAAQPPFVRDVLADAIGRLASPAETAAALGRAETEVAAALDAGLAALGRALEEVRVRGAGGAGGAGGATAAALTALERAAYPTVETRLPEPPPGYRLHRVLGRGGMGVVYLAERLADGRFVALKVLPTSAKGDVESVVRFRREARAAAALVHPRLVHVVDYGVAPLGPYFAMEFVPGGDLARLVARTRAGGSDGLPPDVAARGTALARRFAELADALSYAHAQGFVHRDVKPSNIFVLPDGGMKLGDFGLATVAGGARAPRDGAIVGSAATMAPEQARGDVAALGPRTDVYSLGASLYEALTLRPAYAGDDFTGTAEAVVRGALTPPRAIDSRIAPDLEAVVLKAMAYRPGDRYPTAAAFAADLRAAAEGRPTVATRRGAGARALVALRRHAWPILGVAAVLASALLFALRRR